MAIYGLALILTLFTMAPVGLQINDNLKATPIVFNSPNVIEQINTQAIAPYRDFLQKNSSKTQVDFLPISAIKLGLISIKMNYLKIHY